MGGVIGFGQMLKVKSGIDLRGADIGMAQQFLHPAQITAGLQHMAGKRVPEHVRVHWRWQTCSQATLAQPLPDGLRR